MWSYFALCVSGSFSNSSLGCIFRLHCFVPIKYCLSNPLIKSPRLVGYQLIYLYARKWQCSKNAHFVIPAIITVYDWFSCKRLTYKATDYTAVVTPYCCSVFSCVNTTEQQYGVATPDQSYLCVIDQAWGQDGWILAKFFFCVFKDREEVEVHKHAENMKNEANIQPSWPNKLGQ